MKKLLTSFYSLVATVVSTIVLLPAIYGQTGIVADPVNDYLQTGDLRLEFQQNKELLKLTLDVNGDGKPCVLLTIPSLYVKRAGYNWSLYVPVDGGYRKADLAGEGQNLVFSPSHLALVNTSELAGKRALLTYYISQGNGQIHAYWLKNDSVQEQIIATFKVQEGGTESDTLYPPVFNKYFPGAGTAEAETIYPVEHIPLSDLRSRGYPVP